MLEKLNAGMTLSEIGACYGTNRRSVAKYFKAAGIDHRHMRNDKHSKHNSDKRLARLPREQIIAEHVAGDTVQALATRYKADRKNIRKIIDQSGIERRRDTCWASREKALEGREEEAAAAYLGGKTMEEVAEEMDVSVHTLAKELDELGIDRRHSFHTYAVNEHFFDTVDTEAKAYWFGFILADGCVTGVAKKIPSLKIGLNNIDTEHLEKFKRDIGSTHPITLNKALPDAVFVSIGSKILVNRLIEMGCIERKTWGFPTPTCVPEHLVHHYIRGFFDGDGYISDGGESGSAWAITIVGTESFLIWVSDWIATKLQLDFKNIPLQCSHTDVIKRLSYGGALKVRKVMDMLYTGATVYLDRKHKRYEALIAHNENMADRWRG
jgi:DNA-binding CsgD family transcriptional regulator